MAKVLLNIFFALLMVGACGVMNEAGAIQPVCVVMCLMGALGMFLIGRVYYFD